jgi:hypothetical protein
MAAAGSMVSRQRWFRLSGAVFIVVMALYFPYRWLRFTTILNPRATTDSETHESPKK